jgi:hypothetical protein
VFTVIGVQRIIETPNPLYANCARNYTVIHTQNQTCLDGPIHVLAYTVNKLERGQTNELCVMSSSSRSSSSSSSSVAVVVIAPWYQLC